MATPRKPSNGPPAPGRRRRNAPGAGRPPALIVDEKLVSQVRTLAALGLTQDQVCLVLGVGVSTLQSYQREHPEIARAYQEGRAQGLSRVTRRLFEMAMGSGREAITACIFYLKTQGRWSEAPTTLQHTGLDGGPIRVEDSQQRLGQLLEKLARCAAATPAEGPAGKPDNG